MTHLYGCAPVTHRVHVLQEATVALSRCPLIANPPPLILDSRNPHTAGPGQPAATCLHLTCHLLAR